MQWAAHFIRCLLPSDRGHPVLSNRCGREGRPAMLQTGGMLESPERGTDSIRQSDMKTYSYSDVTRTLQRSHDNTRRCGVNQANRACMTSNYM